MRLPQFLFNPYTSAFELRIFENSELRLGAIGYMLMCAVMMDGFMLTPIYIQKMLE